MKQHMGKHPQRREQITLTRLQIGYTQLTHDHLLKKASPNIRKECGNKTSVKIILLE